MRYSLVALAMLLIWGVGIAFFNAPGAIHVLLSGGVALWVYGVVTPEPDGKK